MLTTLTNQFNDFSSRFTYRQRFFFWCSLFVIFAPFSTYWILQSQAVYREQVSLQLQGTQEARMWFAVYDALLEYEVEWAEAIAAGNADHLPIEALKGTIADALESLKKQSMDSDVQEIPRKSLLGQTVLIKNYQEEIAFLEQLREQIVKHGTNAVALKLWIAKVAAKLRQIAFDYQLVLQSDEKMHHLAELIYFDLPREQARIAGSLSKSSVAMEGLRKQQAEASAEFDQQLKKELSFYQLQRYLVFLYIGALAILLVIFLIFRFVTRHFIHMRNYIRGLSRGEILTAAAESDDEIGQISLALQTMGSTIFRIVQQLEALDQEIASAITKIEMTAHEQTNAVALQEQYLTTLNSNIRQIAEKSRELADTMGTFTQMSQQRLREDTSRVGLNHLQIKINVLKDSSNAILQTLAVVHEKEVFTRTITKLMTKISEHASLLALNAAIEVLHVKRAEPFTDTTEKIQNFAVKTASSTRIIQKIMTEMASSVSMGSLTAQNCIKEITLGANRLIEVSHQLNTIASQDEVKNQKFLSVNELMQSQAQVSEIISTSVTSIDSISADNTAAVRQLYQTIHGLMGSAQDLRRVVSSLFSAGARNP